MECILAGDEVFRMSPAACAERDQRNWGPSSQETQYEWPWPLTRKMFNRRFTRFFNYFRQITRKMSTDIDNGIRALFVNEESRRAR